LVTYRRAKYRQIGQRRGASWRERAAYRDIRERSNQRTTKHQVDMTSKEKGGEP
jgi:hypothetical protein